MSEDKMQEPQGNPKAVPVDMADQNSDSPELPTSSADPTVSQQATTSTHPSDVEVVIPVVEVLPPAEEIDPSLQGNVLIDRTQFSVGLSGLSLQRTRMSSANEGEPPQSQPVTASATHPKTPPDALSDTAAATGPATTPAAADPVSTPAAPEEAGGQSIESMQLFTRFLIGAAIYGYDEVLTRLKNFEQQIQENPDDYDLTDHLLKQLDETEDDVDALFRYWAIGMFLWSERTALEITDRGFRMSLNAGAYALRTVDRTASTFVWHPFLRPFRHLTQSLSNGTQARIAEGRTVEKKDRVLAELTMNDIVSDVIDYISDNPQLAELVSEQGLGFATTVMDNGRQIGAMSDNAVEGIVRRIFRRKPRQDVPPSPLAGEAQTMYNPTDDKYNQPKEKKGEK